MYKIRRYLLCLSFIGWFASALAPALADKEELVIGITQFPSSFHPNINSMLAGSYIHAMTARPFTTYDKDWKLICLLCVQLPTIENGLAKIEHGPSGRDGIAVTYRIQPNATWGDGVPVSTKDVEFTWRVGRHPQSGVINIEFYRSLYKIDVIDSKTFTMHFDKVSFDFNAINDFQLIPAHVDAKNFDDPATYRNRTAFNTTPLNKALYFGPYVISQIVAGTSVVLQPNPTWYGKKPVFRKIIVRVIENTAALEANLLSGGIDMIAGEMGLDINQTISFEKRHGDDFNIIYQPGLIYEHADLNLDNPILRDISVRRALLYALNRSAISERLFNGRQPVADSSVSPLDSVFAKDLKGYSYDPKRAAELLVEAGWDRLKGGYRYNQAGEKLSLQIMTTAGNRTRELVEQILQSQWKAVGIDISIKNQPARVFFGQTVTRRTFSGLAMFAWLSSPENVPRTILHSSNIPTEENNYAGQNYTGFHNTEMDQLIDRIEVELDREKRRNLWHRLQEIYISDVPVIPLYFQAQSFILPKWLQGVQPTGHMYPTTLWVENWRVGND